MYKDKYKKKKSDQAMSSGKLDEASEERPVSVTKQRLGTTGDRPARPSLIEQVLNQKRLSLLRSPEVISFLQQQQRLLTTQNRAQTQHNYWRLKMFYSSRLWFNADTFSMTFLQRQYSILVWEPLASVTYNHPWWCGDYQHCILKTWMFDKDLIDLKYFCHHQSLLDHEMN